VGEKKYFPTGREVIATRMGEIQVRSIDPSQTRTVNRKKGLGGGVRVCSELKADWTVLSSAVGGKNEVEINTW